MGALTSSTVEYYTLSTFYETFSHTNPVCMNSDASRPIRASVVPMLHGKNKHGPMSRTTGMLCSLAILLSCIRICCSCTALHKAEQPELVVLSQPAFCTALDSECRGTVDGSVPDISIKNATHPSPIPEEIHLPWIWDAVLNPERSFVELTVVSPSACEFEHAKWKHAVDSFPQYKDQLADGTLKNVLLHSPGREVFDFIGSKYPEQGIMGKTLTCVFYKSSISSNSSSATSSVKDSMAALFQSFASSRSTVVARTPSYPVHGHSTYFSIGTVQIRCPVPPQLMVKTQHPHSSRISGLLWPAFNGINSELLSEEMSWNGIALERNISALAPMLLRYRDNASSALTAEGSSISLLANVPIASIPQVSARINSTPTVAVCQLPRMYEAAVAASTVRASVSEVSGSALRLSREGRVQEGAKVGKQFGLSACTATGRLSRAYLTEWVEYHRMLGVEHFFMYNTATADRKQDEMAHMLRHYVTEGVVTLVRWPYENCARNMSSGRMTMYSKQRKAYFFQPPRPVAQFAALASCYSRFRHTSRYITHIDDDEFISVSLYKILRGERIIRSTDAKTHTTQVQRVARKMSLDSEFLSDLTKASKLSNIRNNGEGKSAKQALFAINLEASVVKNITGNGRESTAEHHVDVKIFADYAFLHHPEAAAISISPVDMADCSIPPHEDAGKNYPFLIYNYSSSWSATPSVNSFSSIETLLLPPPRVGNWMYGRLGERSNPKLILHTERAGMFHIHYLSMLEQPHRWFDDVINSLLKLERSSRVRFGPPLSDAVAIEHIKKSLQNVFSMNSGRRVLNTADKAESVDRERIRKFNDEVAGRRTSMKVDRAETPRESGRCRFSHSADATLIRERLTTAADGRKLQFKKRKPRGARGSASSATVKALRSRADPATLNRFASLAAPYAQSLSEHLLQRSTHHVPLSRAAVLHYREPAYKTGNIYGTAIPIHVPRKVTNSVRCLGARLLTFEAEIIPPSALTRSNATMARENGAQTRTLAQTQSQRESQADGAGPEVKVGHQQREHIRNQRHRRQEKRKSEIRNLASDGSTDERRSTAQKGNTHPRSRDTPSIAKMSPLTTARARARQMRVIRGRSPDAENPPEDEFTHHLLSPREMRHLAGMYSKSMLRV